MGACPECGSHGNAPGANVSCGRCGRLYDNRPRQTNEDRTVRALELLARSMDRIAEALEVRNRSGR